ncbi:MAG: GntR family transcriptional regulator [Pseudomonadota bacterium]
MKLDPGPIPLYHQLENDLRDRIHGGEFASGAALPTEERLCSDYGVSRITVRRALDALISQGLITRRRGVGSFVRAGDAGVRSVRLVGSLDEFLRSAGALESVFLSLDRVIPPAAAAEALRLDDGEEAVRVELASRLEGQPVAYLEIFFPRWVGAAITRADIEERIPTIRMIERKLNLRIARAEQFIDADFAGEKAAPHLLLKPTDPVLRVARIYYAADERPVEAVFVRYHPQRYRYAIEFQAGKTHG